MNKIEEHELKQLQDIQEKYTDISLRLGELSFSEIFIKTQKNKIEEEINILKEEEATLKEFIIQKYGDNININLKTGEY